MQSLAMVKHRRGHRRGVRPDPTGSLTDNSTITPADTPTDALTDTPTDTPADILADTAEPSSVEVSDSKSAVESVESSNTIPSTNPDQSPGDPPSSSTSILDSPVQHNRIVESTDTVPSTNPVQSPGDPPSSSTSILDSPVPHNKSVESSDAVPSAKPTQSPLDPRFSVTVELDTPVQTNKRAPTIIMGEFDDEAAQAAARPKKKGFVPTENLEEANQKISDLEIEVYKLDQSIKQSRKYQAKARADDVAKIKDLDHHISKAEDAYTELEGQNAKLKRELELQRSELQSRTKKGKDVDGQLALAALELRNANDDAKSTSDRAAALQGKVAELQETIVTLSADRTGQDDAKSVNADAANNLMGEQLAAEHDADERDTIIEDLKKRRRILEDEVQRIARIHPTSRGSVARQLGTSISPSQLRSTAAPSKHA